DHPGPSAFCTRTLIQRTVNMRSILDHTNAYQSQDRPEDNDGRNCCEKASDSVPQPTTEPTVDWMHHGSYHRCQDEGGCKRPRHPQYKYEEGCQQEPENNSMSSF